MTNQSHRSQETHSKTKTLKITRGWGHRVMNGRVNEWMDGVVDGWMRACMHDAWVDGRMDA